MSITIRKSGKTFPNCNDLYPKMVDPDRLRMARTDQDDVPLQEFTEIFDNETTKYLEQEPFFHRKDALDFLEKTADAAQSRRYAGYLIYAGTSSEEEEFGGYYVGELPNQLVTDGGIPKDSHLFIVEASDYESANSPV